MKKILLLCIAAIISSSSSAQVTAEDYNRAYELKKRFSSKNIYHSNVTPTWIGDTDKFWYINNTPDGQVYTIVSAIEKSKKELFSSSLLAEKLSQATEKSIDPKELPITRLSVERGGQVVTFDYNDRKWEYNISDNRLKDKAAIHKRTPRHWMDKDDEKGGKEVTSPDKKHIAFIKNDNVYVRNIESGQEKQLSYDGTISNYYSSYISWSPDSKMVSSTKIRPVEKRYVYYVESSPKDQFQPKLHKQEYAKPGDELPFRVPSIFEVETGKITIPSTELFDKQYEVSRPIWSSDSKSVTFEYNQRGHKIYRLLELSAESGEVSTLIEESSDKYINYYRIFRHHLASGNVIWSSERDNWNHLYMYEKGSSEPAYQITKGEWYLREVQKIDEENRVIYFSANGMEKGEDPYLIRYYKIDFDGKNLTSLTPEEGMHKAWYSKDMKYMVDVYSTVESAPKALLRSAENGKVIMEVESADISKLVANGWKAPEVFKAKGRDGKTDMWGQIYRPTNFDKNKKYPVLEYIYQGPGNQYVPKNFVSYNSYMTSIAELGFIVVMVDGMGTSFRSREFENVCYQNLKDAGIPDHIAWIKAAAKEYDYMDIDRVGIFGCSAGGQESMSALLHFPEFYKAAYSACGCHDNRMDKIWWNEQWLGYPIDQVYEENSNTTYAHKLKRPLMLLVGEMDDNVDPSSTMQVVNALVKAHIDFELVVLPGERHTIGEDYGEHKRFDFFVRHLHNQNTPDWSEIKR